MRPALRHVDSTPLQAGMGSLTVTVAWMFGGGDQASEPIKVTVPRTFRTFRDDEVSLDGIEKIVI